MARYIDAELFDKKLAMEVYLADDEDFTKAFVRGMELVKRVENETPTADVQEVVRCKDCKYFYQDSNIKVCKHWNCHSTIDDAYCSYGERRKEDGSIY